MQSFKKFLKELDPEDVTSGQIIRALRKSLGFTLKDVEAISGIRQTHLSAIENDSYELTKKYAEKLAATLGVHPNVILFPEGRKPNEEIKEIEKRRKKFFNQK
jgi:transcriptional regulator with XRE-family HTH domain